MTRYARSKGKKASNHRIGKRCLKTKKYKKDLDLIRHQLVNESKSKVQTNPDEQDVDCDLPSNGQHFCQQCDRYFIDEKSVRDHSRTKGHKRRLKDLLEVPFSQEEAERAAGMGSYVNPNQKIKNKRQKISDKMDDK